ncbi:MAG: MBL fold metallo-hydrolase [Ferruginibacter sp.]
MKIIPLSEGSFTIDATRIFIPFNKETDELSSRNNGSLLVEIQPFVVITEKDIIVLDTGLGFFNSEGVLQIHQNLLNNNIQPESVTRVLLSHLHKDHAGGISCKDNFSGKHELSFKNAMYYISKKEIEYAFEKGTPSYITEDFEVLRTSGKIIFLEEDGGDITENISYEISGGHCPFHTVFRIMEKEEIVFYGGDVAPQLQQMKSRFIAKYDFDGKKSMELRSQWWAKSEQEHWKVLFYHDIKTPVISR